MRQNLMLHINAAQHSVPHDHRDKYAPDPRKSTETILAPDLLTA
jgi:hypothetical protein